MFTAQRRDRNREWRLGRDPDQRFDFRPRRWPSQHRTAKRSGLHLSAGLVNRCRSEFAQLERAGNIQNNTQLLSKLTRQGLQRRLTRLGFAAWLYEDSRGTFANEQDFALLVRNHRGNGMYWLQQVERALTSRCRRCTPSQPRIPWPAASQPRRRGQSDVTRQPPPGCRRIWTGSVAPRSLVATRCCGPR